MGKIDAVVGRVPRLEPDAGKTAWRDAVNAVKDSIQDRTPAALGVAYRAARLEKARIEADVLAPLNVRIRALEYLLFDLFQDAGGGTVKVEGGGSVRVGPKLSAKITDKPAAIAWLKANGLEGLLTVNAQTLAATVSDMVIEGDPIPDGVEVGTYQAVTFSAKG